MIEAPGVQELSKRKRRDGRPSSRPGREVSGVLRSNDTNKGNDMKITKDWIQNNKTKGGGWTRAQLVAIGVTWPPPKDWIRQVIGKTINQDNQAAFERRDL